MVDSWIRIDYVGLGTNSSKVYINGIDTNQVGKTGTISRTRNTNTADIAIGTRSSPVLATPQLDAFVASVHVYGRGLSADEIKQNYEATKGRFGTL